jgi:hypothetical protein
MDEQTPMPTLDFPVTAMYVFDIREYAARIDMQFGVYFKTVDSYNGVKVPVHQIQTINGIPHNVDGEVIITPCSVKHSYPVIATEIVMAYVDKVLTENAAWAPSPEFKPERFFKPEIISQYGMSRIHDFLDIIESSLFDLRRIIHDQIGIDSWMMYFIKRTSSDLIIEATVDYRVYDWMRRKANGEF